VSEDLYVVYFIHCSLIVASKACSGSDAPMYARPWCRIAAAKSTVAWLTLPLILLLMHAEFDCPKPASMWPAGLRLALISLLYVCSFESIV
jgi:hypothetical protein